MQLLIWFTDLLNSFVALKSGPAAYLEILMLCMLARTLNFSNHSRLAATVSTDKLAQVSSKFLYLSPQINFLFSHLRLPQLQWHIYVI